MLDSENKERLEWYLDNLPGSDGLTDWETSFLEDMQERYDEYGENTFVSEKQWAVFERMLERVGL